MWVFALLWLFFGGCWYTFCCFGYNYSWKIFTNNINIFNPMLARANYSKNINLLIMVVSAIIGFAGAIGLWFGWLWAVILAIIISGNEAYRGATYYMKEGLYWESIKHMLIHAFVVGFMLSWILCVKYSIL